MEDDSCLAYQHKDISKVDKNLNKFFLNICDWFVDNKLSIHFREENIKSTLFSTKHKLAKVGSLEIRYGKCTLSNITQ